ncbi:hypothetical protein ACFVUB_30400 [Streptomyces niveus]|uniref:hypothetical protein n=1 Tax=Streptomyces niveus TaxID=193462 RepID=UPI0036D8D56D
MPSTALSRTGSPTLVRPAEALVAASHDRHRGWGEVVLFAACTAARIGEVSGCRVGDVDTTRWIWTVRRPAGPEPDARLFTGPRGGRISSAVLRDATHRDKVVTKLGHDLRHTGLTWSPPGPQKRSRASLGFLRNRP